MFDDPGTSPVVIEQEAEQAQEPVPEEKPRAARKIGKSRDPRYTQSNAYILKTVRREVDMKLLQTGDERDYSQLVEDLLVQWLNSRPGSTGKQEDAEGS